MKTPTAADTYVNFGYEDFATEGTEATSIDQAFGFDTTYTVNRSNQYQKVFNQNSQDVQKLVAKAYTGTVDIDFTLSTPYWLTAVLGAVADGAGPPYDHTYTPANVTPTISIEIGNDIDTDSVQKLLGCRLSSMTLSSAPNDLVKCALSFVYLNELEGTSLGSQVAIPDNPFCYSQATYELPAASTIADLESFDIVVNRNPELVPQQGSRFYAKSVNKAREYQTSLVIPFEAAATILEKFYGTGTGPSTGTPTETATAQIVLTNGAAGVLERTLTIDLAGLGIDTETLNSAPVEIVKENSTLFARTVTDFIWRDNTAVAPESPDAP